MPHLRQHPTASRANGVVARAVDHAVVGGGLYWLLAQFVSGIAVAVYYGWILLIGIRR